MSTISAQTQADFPTIQISDFKDRRPTHCWDNQMRLDLISQSAPRGKSIIIIARLGDKEHKTGLNKRRMSNIATYLTKGVSDQYRRSAESIVTAEGSPTKGYGQVEIYLEGRLIVLLTPYRNADLAVSGCYDGIDGEDACATSRQKLFYPCRDLSEKPKRKISLRK